MCLIAGTIIVDKVWFYKFISCITLCIMLVVCFEVYDFNGDGYISREEMFTCLKKSMVKQTTEEDPDEGIKDLVELALKKMVLNCDNHITYVTEFLLFFYLSCL